MRFGMSGAFLPTRMDGFTDEVARRIRDLGFSGCFTRFTDDPFETPVAKANRVRDLLAAHGLRMYQAIGYRPPLIHPDEAVRREAVRVLGAAVRLTKELGARGTHTGPGSLNPRGAWFPHPYNWTPQARDQLIKSLREVAPAAEDCEVYLGMEGHVLVTLDSAATMAEVLRAVDSPRVRCDLDPVNWMTRETVYDSGPAIARMVDTLGDLIVGGHAKDVTIEDRLVLHLTECPAGTGLLDWDTFLPRIEALDPDFPLVVEHCSTEDLPGISEFLHGKARELGITVLDA
jgi:sugar phosphate isomerase/epimerase